MARGLCIRFLIIGLVVFARLQFAYAGGTRTFESLVEALSRPGQEGQVRAAAALGTLQDKRAVEPLSRAMKDAPTFTLSTLGGHMIEDKSKVVRVIKGERVVPDVAGTVAVALGRIGGAGLDVLEETLKSSNLWLRRSATLGLGFNKTKRAVVLLISALEDSDKFVRQGATEDLKRATGKAFGSDVTKWKAYASKLEQ